MIITGRAPGGAPDFHVGQCVQRRPHGTAQRGGAFAARVVVRSVRLGEFAILVDLFEQIAVDESGWLHEAQWHDGVVTDVGNLPRDTFGERLVGDVGVSKRQADSAIRSIIERSQLVAGHPVGANHVFVDTLGHVLLIAHADTRTRCGNKLTRRVSNDDVASSRINTSGSPHRHRWSRRRRCIATACVARPCSPRRLSLEVPLDDRRSPNRRVSRIASGYAKGAALSQQIPTLIKGDFNLGEPFGNVNSTRVNASQAVLLVDQAVDVADDVRVVHVNLRCASAHPATRQPGTVQTAWPLRV